MFVQHKQLTHLNVAAEKVTHLHVASSSVQLAFAEVRPQLCRAYLVRISGGEKTLVVVAFYLLESRSSIFFVPKVGEVSAADAEKVYEEGYSFIESMGFVLTETDFHLLSAAKKDVYWRNLPISKTHNKQVVAERTAAAVDRHPDDSLLAEEVRHLHLRSRESLGRFLASL